MMVMLNLSQFSLHRKGASKNFCHFVSSGLCAFDLVVKKYGEDDDSELLTKTSPSGHALFLTNKSFIDHYSSS